MARNFKLAVCILACGALVSCGVVVEPDISGKEVHLLAPGDQAVLYSDTVTFWWERLPDAHEYEFRLVSPSFANPQRVIADTITPENMLTFRLQRGDYEWEVSGLNNGYATDFFYRSFRVDSVGPGGNPGAAVTLLAPANAASISNEKITFSWETFSGASFYHFQLVSPSFASIQVIEKDTALTTNKLTLQLDSGKHEWRVRAVTDEYLTQWALRNFTLNL